MYTSEKRRVREAEKRVERVRYKFITEYVRCLHGDIYKKAEELYDSTRQKYPDGVKDMTKTVEFMQVTTPNKRIPRYYSSRKTERRGTAEMVLEIPLLDLNKGTSLPPPASSPQLPSSPPPASLPLSEEVFQQLLQELQHDPDLSHILNEFDSHMDVSQQDDLACNDDLWDVIMPDNLTPLEKELLSY